VSAVRVAPLSRKIADVTYLDCRNNPHTTSAAAYRASTLSLLQDSIGRQLANFFPSGGSMEDISRLIAAQVMREFVAVPKR